MRTHKHLVLALLFVVCGAANAKNPPAGTILYFRSGQEVYLLLAEDSQKTRGWGGYGGGAREGESPAQTAARETEEETRGYFAREDLLKRIERQAPVVCDNTFVLFFAEVDFVPASRVTNNQPPSTSRSYTESGPYAWIPFSEIEEYVQTDIDRKRKYPLDTRFLPIGSETDWLWPTWLAGLRDAVELNALPWKWRADPEETQPD